MRIVHVLTERGFSGGEVQLAHVLEHLVARGHENHLFLQPGARFEEVAARHGVSVDRFRMRNDIDPIAVFKIRRRLKRDPPDLLHLACSRSHKLGAFATIGIRRFPIVVTRRMDYPVDDDRFHRWLYGKVVRATVVVSEAVRQEVLQIGVAPERVHVIHDGVDPDRFAGIREGCARARAELGLPPNALVVLSAGALRPRKGHAVLLRAFARLAARVPAAHLLIAGEGKEERRLRAQAAEIEGGERVHLPGRLRTEDAIAAADVACVPSLREGLSVFSLEAQAAGLPVVASRVGGLPEAVADGETGLLVEPGDADGLARALERLLSDEALRYELGAAGIHRVLARFTARRMAEQTEALYLRL